MPTEAGQYRDVVLPQGTLRYRDEGNGPAVVFIHGLLANATLWRKVIPRLSGEFRCIAPDLPLGGHSIPMGPDVDLTPDGVARIIADLLEALDLRDVTLVGTDTGGALCQVVITQYPDRIARLVLTNCDAYKAFFPPWFSWMQLAAHLFGLRFVDFLAFALHTHRAQRTFVLTVARTARDLDVGVLDAYFGPLLRNQAIRRDVTRFLRGVSNRYTLNAARAFPRFQLPVLLVWGEDDLFFSVHNARRLQRDFPKARLELLPRCRAFVSEDQPDALAQRVAEFIHADDSIHPAGSGAA